MLVPGIRDDQIDELKGKAVARNVALAQGWTYRENGADSWWQYAAEPRALGWMERAYRPDRLIAQAWDLVGMCNFTVAPLMPIVAQFNSCKGRTGWVVYDCGGTPLAFANLPSLSELCAAICSAFLKARGTSDVDGGE